MKFCTQCVARMGCRIAAVCLLVLGIAHGHSENAAPITVERYQARLQQLGQLVNQCRTDAGTCKPDAVGADDVVALPGEVRRVDYGWLRDTLKAAAVPDSAGKDSVNDRKKVDALLEASALRLKTDSAEATELQVRREEMLGTTLSHAKPVLKEVLAGSEFHNLTQPSIWDKFWQHFFAWLDERLRGLSGAGASSRIWVRLLTYGSIVICLTLLLWWYVRQIRQQRILLATGRQMPHPSSASAVDWQQRLQQAQALAAAGDWRGAVHLMYWAAISRLEALGNWPADRARTPREYLLLLPAAHRKRNDLTTLTRTFERTWYGRMPAMQDDFEQALSLLEKLVKE